MFIGLFTPPGGRDAREIASAERLAACFPQGMPSDKIGHWAGPNAVMAGALMWNTPASKSEAVPEICKATGRVILSWARIDNRAQMCADLALSLSDSLSDPQIILAAHARYGEDCAEKLDGDFSFVIFDPADGSVLCARDIMGARPLFYCATAEFLLVATSAAMIKASGLVPLTANPRWIVQTLAMNALEPESTAYEEIKRLPSAHIMRAPAANPEPPRRYFAFRTDAPHATQRDPQWVERHRAAFHAAIERRAVSDFRVGAEYSAGLDSTSILSHLVNVLPHPAEDFHVFADLATWKEAETLLPPALKYGVRHTHVLARHNRLQLGEDFAQSLDVIGYPVEHTQTLMHKPFLEMARQFGIRTLISGYGGDELVTSSASYASWELLEQGALGTVFDMRPGSAPNRALQTARMHLGRGRADAGEDLKRTLLANLASAPLRREVIEEHGLHAHIDRLVEPIRGYRKQSEISAGSPYASIAPMVRLESYSLFARQFGIEYRWPMLDRALVQNYLLTPAVEKRRGQWGRYLHRRAMDGVVPDAINWNPNKYLGDPVGLSDNSPLPPKSEALDLAPCLQDIVDPALVETLYDTVAADMRAENYNPNSMVNTVVLFSLIRLNLWVLGESE